MDVSSRLLLGRVLTDYKATLRDTLWRAGVERQKSPGWEAAVGDWGCLFIPHQRRPQLGSWNLGVLISLGDEALTERSCCEGEGREGPNRLGNHHGTNYLAVDGSVAAVKIWRLFLVSVHCE